MAILFYLACLLIGVLPVVAIGLPWWGSFIIILILQFIPASAAIFWIWGLIVTIGGPQDWFRLSSTCLVASSKRNEVSYEKSNYNYLNFCIALADRM